ncbi:MAG TPA: tripartite tricarboxylate transporter substrate binding protein [Candidatus Limnocylindria bacterium]|nr:tripartite tricarboxylate transporter substrate binding protein [Candidatus Limnocylindria bacterium]
MEVQDMDRSIWRSVSILAAGLLAVAACGGGGTTTPTAAPTGAQTAAPTVVAAVPPTRATEFVVQTAPGGSSDIYARFWIGVMEKDKLVPQPVQPVNKEGGAGAVAFTYVFEKRADPHYLMVTLNSFWTTIITQKALPYKTTDFTPIVNMALDPFFLWVAADSPIKTAQDFVKEATAREMTASGTGSKQEDEVLFRRIQELAKTKPFKYVPQSGGGAVATALAGKQGGVEVTVNNPSEARALFQQNRLRAVCAFTPAAPSGIFKDVPTCKSQGLAIDDYYNVRAVVAPPGLTAGQQKFWIDTFQKISNHADWKKFMEDNAIDPDFKAGEDFKKLIENYQKIHEEIATKFGWIT